MMIADQPPSIIQPGMVEPFIILTDHPQALCASSGSVISSHSPGCIGIVNDRCVVILSQDLSPEAVDVLFHSQFFRDACTPHNDL